jgi:hypothetical protein
MITPTITSGAAKPAAAEYVELVRNDENSHATQKKVSPVIAMLQTIWESSSGGGPNVIFCPMAQKIHELTSHGVAMATNAKRSFPTRILYRVRGK